MVHCNLEVARRQVDFNISAHLLQVTNSLFLQLTLNIKFLLSMEFLIKESFSVWEISLVNDGFPLPFPLTWWCYYNEVIQNDLWSEVRGWEPGISTASQESTENSGT